MPLGHLSGPCHALSPPLLPQNPEGPAPFLNPSLKTHYVTQVESTKISWPTEPKYALINLKKLQLETYHISQRKFLSSGALHMQQRFKIIVKQSYTEATPEFPKLCSVVFDFSDVM